MTQGRTFLELQGRKCLAAGSVQKFRAGNVSWQVLVRGRESLGALCMPEQKHYFIQFGMYDFGVS